MIDKKSIEREVKKALKNGTLKTEEDAKNIAKRYITKDEEDYQITIAISHLLPRTVHKIIHEKIYKHPWFKGKTTHMVYIDIWGRMWSRTVGVRKDNIKTRKSEVFGYCIDKLGGMMWASKRGRTFICEYRTTEEEMNERTRPETFVG